MSALVLAATMFRVSEDLGHLWKEHAASLSILLLPPLILLAVVLTARLGLNSGPPTLSRGELDRLIRHKHQGRLLHRSRRIRDQSARINSYIPNLGPSAAPGLAHLASPEGVLDRLMQAKRRWKR